MRLRASEADILASCLDYLATTRRAFAWRQNQGRMKIEDASKRDGFRYVQFAGVRGISDIIGVLKCGHFLAVECKRKDKKPTFEQSTFLGSAERFNGCAIVARSIDDLADGLDKHDEGCTFRRNR